VAVVWAEVKANLLHRIRKLKTRIHIALLALTLLSGIHPSSAQGARFFRISGPAPATIIAFRPDGTLVWSNSLPGTNYTVQTASSLTGGTNWASYVQIYGSNGLNTNLLVSFNPFAGMTLIPAGSFTIGDALDGESDAIPTASVNVSAFYMDVNLVTSSQWRSVYNFAANHGFTFDHGGSNKDTNQPVQTVSWFDTLKWCNARSQQAGLTPVYYTDAALQQVYTNSQDYTPYVNWTANGYRLPTEAEWEKAARGGLGGLRFPWGDTISESQANYYGNTAISYDLGPNGYNSIGSIEGTAPATSPVGSFAPNGYGLYDMAGNVWEWCWDWYGAPPYPLPKSPPYYPPGSPYLGGSDPHGPDSGNYRVLRGGYWGFYANVACCAFRENDIPTYADNQIGFRCVRTH